jgi:hypothetical protein
MSTTGRRLRVNHRTGRAFEIIIKLCLERALTDDSNNFKIGFRSLAEFFCRNPVLAISLSLQLSRLQSIGRLSESTSGGDDRNNAVAIERSGVRSAGIDAEFSAVDS